MEPASPDPTTPRRIEEANVFRVEFAGARGWVVHLVGHPETHHFSSQDLAVKHAQKCARDRVQAWLS